MRTLAALAAAAFALLAPSGAGAQPVSAPSGPDTYLQFHGGPFMPQSGDLDGYDTGYDFGALFGVRFTRNVSAEGGIGFYRTTLSETALGLTTESALRAIPLTASVRARLPYKFAELSAFGGIGFHFARLSTDTTTSAVPPVTASDSANSTAFGFHVGAAAAFNVWPTMLIGAEVVRTFVPAKFEGVETRLDGMRAALTLTYRL